MPASSPSSPSSAPDATATAQLTIRTADALAEVAVRDGHLNSVASGVGGLVAKLRPGLYQIDVRTGPAVEQRLVSLEHDLQEVFAATDADAASVKVLGSELASLRTIDRGRGSVLTIWVKDPGSSEAPFDRSARRMLSVVNPQGELLADLDADGQSVPDDPSTFACRINMSPGLNRVKVVLPSGKTIERAAIPVAGWETDIHLERRQYMRAAAIDLTGGTMLMRPVTAAPDPQFDGLTETALYALVHGRDVVSDRMSELLQGKFVNPLFGLIAAHLILRDRGAKDALLPMVIDNTGAMLGRDHPDVKALKLTQPRTAAGPVVFDLPPMLRKSWDLIVAGTFDGTAQIDPKSPAGVASGRIVPGGAWLAWKDLDASDVADDGTGLRSGLRNVVSDFVKQVSTQVASAADTGAAILGVDDASHADEASRGGGMPRPQADKSSSVVSDVLRQVGALSNDAKVELGRTLGIPRHLLDSMLQKLGS